MYCLKGEENHFQASEWGSNLCPTPKVTLLKNDYIQNTRKFNGLRHDGCFSKYALSKCFSFINSIDFSYLHFYIFLNFFKYIFESFNRL